MSRRPPRSTLFPDATLFRSGLLIGEMKAPLAPDDYHNHFSRFQGENLIKNLEKVDLLKKMAKEKGYTPTQLAIAWVNAQGDHIMPLVSMSRRSRLPENMSAMEIVFTPEEMRSEERRV